VSGSGTWIRTLTSLSRANFPWLFCLPAANTEIMGLRATNDSIENARLAVPASILYTCNRVVMQGIGSGPSQPVDSTGPRATSSDAPALPFVVPQGYS
jgi:hypothetical protein